MVSRQILFGELQPSDEFIVDGCTFVKMYPIGYLHVPELTYNAVNLVTGLATRFKNYELVEVRYV